MTWRHRAVLAGWQELVLLCVLALAIAIPSRAQFAIVRDPDGYLNVHNAPQRRAPVTDTLGNGHPVFCLEAEQNWLPVDYVRSGSTETGYVYRDRVLFVDAYTRIPLRSMNDDTLVFRSDSLRFEVITRPFRRDRHVLKYDSAGQVYRIDGRMPWGAMERLPEREYGAIRLRVAGRRMSLPAEAIRGLYEPYAESFSVYRDPAADVIYLVALNGDAAGGYEVLWRILNGRYLDRFVTHGF